MIKLDCVGRAAFVGAGGGYDVGVDRAYRTCRGFILVRRLARGSGQWLVASDCVQKHCWVERTTDGQVYVQVLRGEVFVQDNNEEDGTATKTFGMDGSKKCMDLGIKARGKLLGMQARRSVDACARVTESECGGCGQKCEAPNGRDMGGWVS